MPFFTGTPEKFERRSTLGEEQQPLYQQLLKSIQGPGGGGAYGQSADYYRDLLGNNSEDFKAFAQPELRRFNEQTVPGLAEQFAGMGAGGLSSSGFRNAAVNAGTDLSERLAAMRSQLRQQGAQGLQNIGQQGLQQYNENIFRPRQPGFLEQLSPAAGALGAGLLGGPVGSLSQSLSQSFGNWLNPSQKGQSSPYGNQQQNMQGMR